MTLQLNLYVYINMFRIYLLECHAKKPELYNTERQKL